MCSGIGELSLGFEEDTPWEGLLFLRVGVNFYINSSFGSSCTDFIKCVPVETGDKHCPHVWCYVRSKATP